jgi:hypothetical protein
MVCNYTDEWEDQEDKRNQVRKEELDLTTRLLCDMMKAVTFLEDSPNPDLYFHPKKFVLETIPGLKQWWEKHQKADKKKS